MGRRVAPDAGGQVGRQLALSPDGVCAITLRVEQPVWSGRFVDIAEQFGEELLVFAARDAIAGAEDRTPGRAAVRAVRSPAVQDGPNLVEHHLGAGVVVKEMVDLQKREPSSVHPRCPAQRPHAASQRRPTDVEVRGPGG